MGYCCFALIFDDGSEVVYGTGSVADFIRYPPGKTAINVAGLKQMTHYDKPTSPGRDFSFCLYSDET